MVLQIKLHKNGTRHSGGWVPKPFMEKKIMVFGTVKRMYHKEAQAAVKELLKQWR